MSEYGWRLTAVRARFRERPVFRFPWKRGGFIIFSVISNMKTEPARDAVKDERLTDYRKAVAALTTGKASKDDVTVHQLADVPRGEFAGAFQWSENGTLIAVQ